MIEKIQEILKDLASRDIKEWYYSKTIWINIIYILSIIIQAKYGFIVSPEEQLAFITIINLILRATTKKGLKI